VDRTLHCLWHMYSPVSPARQELSQRCHRGHAPRDRGRRVVASVAPSYAGVFEPWEQKRLPSALRRLGFAYVAETAVAASAVARAGAAYLRERPNQSHVWSSCPAVTEYVRRYRPSDAAFLVPSHRPCVAMHAGCANAWDRTFGSFSWPLRGQEGGGRTADCKGLVDVVFDLLKNWRMVHPGIDRSLRV